MTFINLTPHDITVFVGDGSIVIPASGTVARVSSIYTHVGDIDGIPVSEVSYGDVHGLPQPMDGVIYVVSALVLNALKAKGVNRTDVVAPDTDKGAVRDTSGRIIGVRGFIK